MWTGLVNYVHLHLFMKHQELEQCSSSSSCVSLSGCYSVSSNWFINLWFDTPCPPNPPSHIRPRVHCEVTIMLLTNIRNQFLSLVWDGSRPLAVVWVGTPDLGTSLLAPPCPFPVHSSVCGSHSIRPCVGVACLSVPSCFGILCLFPLWFICQNASSHLFIP